MIQAITGAGLRGCGYKAAAVHLSSPLARPWRGEAKAADAAARRLRA